MMFFRIMAPQGSGSIQMAEKDETFP